MDPTDERLKTANGRAWQLERRGDGVLLVRVKSRDIDGRQVPDAVFSFRRGDPQYGYWEAKLREQELAEK